MTTMTTMTGATTTIEATTTMMMGGGVEAEIPGPAEVLVLVLGSSGPTARTDAVVNRKRLNCAGEPRRTQLTGAPFESRARLQRGLFGITLECEVAPGDQRPERAIFAMIGVR
jgi:hypothetical protein